MLRLLAALLLTANLAVYAWTQGWLTPLAMPPMSSEREPERLAQQVRPESIKLLTPQDAAEARRAAQAASSATPSADTSRLGASAR